MLLFPKAFFESFVHDHVHEIVAGIYFPIIRFIQLPTKPVLFSSPTDSGEEPKLLTLQIHVPIWAKIPFLFPYDPDQ